MAFLNLPAALWRRLLLIGQGSLALALLLVAGVGALAGRNGDARSRIAAALTSASGQRRMFAVLRLFKPNLVTKRVLIRSYPNNATAVVARCSDVRDLLSRDDDFGVVYSPRMQMITGGEDFFLGMQDTAPYVRDTSTMRLAMRREDAAQIVKPFLASTAAELVEAAAGRIDVPQMLTIPAAARLLEHYFGTPGPSQTQIAQWTTTLFWYLFLDLKADPVLDEKARTAAAEFRDWLDNLIAQRHASRDTRDDVLGRYLAMQSAAFPGTSDTDIRNNLIGLLIGELPTTSAAANLALDELLERPAALEGAQAAARSDNDTLLAAYVFEALRFRPLNPVIYRRALRDAWVAQGTLRGQRIPEGTMVLASNLSAMFDPLAVRDPAHFRTDRPWSTYMLWGYGMHTCFGAHLNRVSLPAILKPLLQQDRLRRTNGGIDTAGTPFPVHLELAFDRRA
jgi:cytochrome P450